MLRHDCKVLGSCSEKDSKQLKGLSEVRREAGGEKEKGVDEERGAVRRSKWSFN